MTTEVSGGQLQGVLGVAELDAIGFGCDGEDARSVPLVHHVVEVTGRVDRSTIVVSMWANLPASLNVRNCRDPEGGVTGRTCQFWSYFRL